MAHPKRRHSNARTGKRRANDFLTTKSLSVCSNCGEKILPHRVCPKCGYYKGKQTITIKTKSKKEEK